MSNEFFTPQSRNEAILQNICGANNVLPEPQSRIEKLLQAILYEDATIVDFTPESRAELLLYAILTHGEYDAEPQSRNETILRAILTNGDYDALPQSRIEALLIEWLDQTHYEEKTVSGDVVSISDAVDAPVSDLTAAIVPVQSGSGDPSPENIRPISGWTECKVTRAGSNLLHNYPARTTSGITFEYDNTQNCYRIYGTPTNTFVSSYCIGGGAVFIETNLFPNVEYIFSMTGDVPAMVKKIQLEVLYDDNTSDLFLAGVPFTLQKESTRQRVRWYDNNNVGPEFNSANTYDIKLYTQLELGSAATAYEPYRGDTYTVTFGSAGTVYGGTLDVTTGTLTVTWAIVDLGTLDWIKFSVTQGNLFRSARVADSAHVYNSTNFICSNYATTTSAARANGTISAGVNKQFDIIDNSFSDAAAFKAAMSGVQLVYELATPIVYDLTPVEIRTLAGQNTIWADTGDVTVTYKAQRTAAALMMMAGRF